MSFKEKIDIDRLPRHIAVIMDGNGRWAKEKGKLRVFGHQNGVKAVRDTVEAAAELGVEYLTLYAFSTENWKRPALEVTALMELLISTINRETKTLMENDVRLNAIGDLKSLPSRCYKELMEAIDKTANNKRLTLNLALSYSSRWELVEMAKKLATKIKNNELEAADVNEELVSSLLCTADMPDPELLIRTSGEHRISNFLLWQIAYSELYFTDTFWPDFRREHLYEAIFNYQNRERRFGKTSEQVI
ncbi:isoprenyl transferase [Solitalea longa]|uniref:Isoprenyl transferase n=1 Tax=Solitalea longa TaxID=2079460 RepID=A0A2S5A6V2_9SPHI|nr:isoprenyl transferase [Solitalea longa]POY38321.1 isoprenyl transferase [Solitalea longa]